MFLPKKQANSFIPPARKAERAQEEHAAPPSWKKS